MTERSEQTSPSLYRFLVVAGAINRWFYLAFALATIWIIWLRVTTGRYDSTNFLFLCLFPLAAGSGILSIARSGAFDLLLGRGVTRSRLWRAGLVHAWVVPSVLSAIVYLLGTPHDHAEALARLFPYLVFAGGIAFALGLVEVRYFAGIIWLVSRFIFLIVPAGLQSLMQLSKGIATPSAGTLWFCIVAAPESLTEPRMPLVYLVVAALVGTVALALSYRWLTVADFGGKRS